MEGTESSTRFSESEDSEFIRKKGNKQTTKAFCYWRFILTFAAFHHVYRLF